MTVPPEEYHLVLKPDGLRPEVEAAVLRESSAEAAIVRRFELLLAPDEVYLWYPYLNDEPDAEVTLVRYLSEGPIAVFDVAGASARAEVLRWKRELRRRFADDDVRNAVHAPDSVYDFRWERLLFVELARAPARGGRGRRAEAIRGLVPRALDAPSP